MVFFVFLRPLLQILMSVSPTMVAVSRTVTTLMEASSVPVALGTAWTAMDSTAAVRSILTGVFFY